MTLIVSSTIFLSTGPSFITVRFSLSAQLLSRDFSFYYHDKESGRGKSKKGAERNGGQEAW
jgi:hypothetical protein